MRSQARQGPESPSPGFSIEKVVSDFSKNSLRGAGGWRGAGKSYCEDGRDGLVTGEAKR